MSRLEAATPAPDLLVYEATDTPTNTPLLTSGVLRRGGKLNGWGVVTQNLLGAILGAPGLANLAGQRWWRTATSGGGGEGEQSTNTSLDAWPIGVDIAQYSADLRLPARYEFDIMLLRTPAPLALDVPFGVTLGWVSGTQNLLSLAVNTWVGVSVESRTAVNGGNWTRYLRATSGVAIASVDTLLHPDAGVLHVMFRYDATAVNPTLSLFLNGTLFESWVGLANLLQPVSFAAGLFRIMVTQNSAIVGQTDGWLGSHLKVTRLPGFALV